MKQVALLIETSLASGRDILGGISRFLHEQNSWCVFHQTGPLGAMNPASLENWSGDGIIARITDHTMLRLVRKKRVPVVDVLGNVPDTNLPLITPDDRAIARLVHGHFSKCGFRHFAFFGWKHEPWSERREQAFAECVLTDSNNTFEALGINHDEKQDALWPAYLKRLTDWITTLPKPVALMTSSDQLALDIIEACRRLSILIPEQVAIIGVDDDAAFCDLCMPRLSSVMPDHIQVGYEAARLLDGLMNGASAPPGAIRIPPQKLRLRDSSDVIAVDDPALIKACRLIRTHACEGIQVNEIARATGLSRSVLQRRFLKSTGKTVFDAILTTKLTRAKEMIANTPLPLMKIAAATGFKHQEYLGAVIKRHTGLTATQYRKNNSS
ncbi:MAG TPA: DNA-binding transcriptional regulator [Rariglobus sp.]|jgi:LacI family transcriptional regulator|nr:DNA-binding transcriptional regulator [Rariglobus sp.]